MTTIQSEEHFELQYRHNGVWLDRNSGSTDYLGAFNPGDLLFSDYRSALHALYAMENIGTNPDNLRIVGIDLTDVD
jgi:hypothetical protein